MIKLVAAVLVAALAFSSGSVAAAGKSDFGVGWGNIFSPDSLYQNPPQTLSIKSATTDDSEVADNTGSDTDDDITVIGRGSAVVCLHEDNTCFGSPTWEEAEQVARQYQDAGVSVLINGSLGDIAAEYPFWYIKSMELVERAAQFSAGPPYLTPMSATPVVASVVGQ